MASTGFVLLDLHYRPVFANPEAIKILGFPNTISNPASLDGILSRKILSFLPAGLALSKTASITQFQSGKRRYLCRAFILENHWTVTPVETRIALVLERGLLGPPASSRRQTRLAGMHDDPFSFSPDAKYYNFSRAHRDVLLSLRDMVCEARGIGVLLGQAGMGKTILLSYLAETLRDTSDIAVFPNSFESRAELVRAVMASFGADKPGSDLPENLERFEKWLLSKHLAGRRVLLICDDAQELTFETIENLCLLSDLQAGPQKLLQIVLAGRQGLFEKLSAPRLETISDRINMCCRLAPLDESEARSYVLHRLRVAGCTREVFSSGALSMIALYSRGIPLNINMICRHSLSLAAAINLQVIDERIVADSAYDLVLRAQPAGFWDEPEHPPLVESRGSGALRDRRGLRLVKK